MSKNKEKIEHFAFYVAGVQHHDLSTVINEIVEGDLLNMVPEPTNKYDKNAIKLTYDSEILGHEVMLGYVPGKLSAQVSALLEVARDPFCEVFEVNHQAKPWNQLKVSIQDFIY